MSGQVGVDLQPRPKPYRITSPDRRSLPYLSVGNIEKHRKARVRGIHQRY